MSSRLQEILTKANTTGKIATLILDGTEGIIIAGAGKNVFDSDGSGYLAGGNIMWDGSGNLAVNGYFQSNGNGNRIIIDPNARNIIFLNANDKEVIKQDFFINSSYSGGKIRINLINQATGENHCYCEIDGGKVAVYSENGTSFFRADAYQKRIWIDADSLPQDRNNAYPDEVYMDGETLKIKRTE